MDTGEIIREVLSQAVVKIDRDALATVLDAAETIRAEDTGLAGRIRLLSLEGQILVQEETPDREVLLRRLGSVEAAGRFIDRRLADYERMWDGCGCTIDYTAPADEG